MKETSSLLFWCSVGAFVVFGISAATLTLQSCSQPYALSGNQYNCIMQENTGLFSFGEVALISAAICLGCSAIVRAFEATAAC